MIHVVQNSKNAIFFPKQIPKSKSIHFISNIVGLIRLFTGSTILPFGKYVHRAFFMHFVFRDIQCSSNY